VSEQVQLAVAAVWRIESARLIGALTRRLGDLAEAEDLAQEALLAALQQWPSSGVPDNPGAWLMSVAKHRAIDAQRHGAMAEHHHMQIGRELDAAQEHNLPLTLAEESEDRAVLDDDVLRLMFIACHPVLSTDAQLALTLRLLGGLSTAEIARAFLQPEATIAQRIVRAKRSLGAAKVPFELPAPAALAARLDAVLRVIYLIFNEGYTATAGPDWMRPTLCEEAMRLGRMLVSLAPRDVEVLGLLALMELQAARAAARVDAQGQPVLLLEQNRSRWDALLIRRGLAGLQQAESLGVALGPYALQAAIAACHARARQAADTDWQRIVALYDALHACAPSPVVALNRAVAISMADGPAAGLDALQCLLDEPALARYHLLPSVLGDLLCRLGRMQEAEQAFRDAAALTSNRREQALLLQRAEACMGGQSLH